MAPETSTSPESSPQDFNFMMGQKPQPAGQGPAGKLANLGLPAKIIAALIVIFIIVIVVAMVFSSGGGPTKQVVDLMAQSQEISRVSQLEDQNFQDPNTKGLSATTQAAMASQQAQFSAFLASNRVKYGPKDLALRTNKNTDAQLQAAAQNNNLDSAYAQYLKDALITYQNSLSSAYKDSKSKSLKVSLQS